MNGAGRANPTTKPARAAAAAGGSGGADGHMGQVVGPQIDLGITRRRVTGNDLFMFHALVSQNDQTIEDLTELRPSDEAALARYARQERPPFVTEGLLDRMNDRLTGWLTRRARAARQWLFGGPGEPMVGKVRGKPRDARDAGRRTPSPPPAGQTRAPKRAA